MCLVLAPGLWLVACFLSGIAQGASYAALFTIVIRRSVGIDEDRETSTFIQTIGYLVVATPDRPGLDANPNQKGRLPSPWCPPSSWS